MDIETEHASTNSICIIGLGYVGLPLALLFAQKKFNVIGLDLDSEKIDKLNNGISYLTDIEDAEIKAVIDDGSFTATMDYSETKKANSIIICVPTPLTRHHTPDLSHLQSVGFSLSEVLQKDQLVILESSTYPGTTKEVLQPILEKSNLRAGKDFYLAYSPERIDPGNKQFKDISKVAKIVSGLTPDCRKAVIDLYSQLFENVVPVSSTEIAEFTKLLENSFRYINISFMNEMAIMCDKLGINLWEAIEAAGTKPYGYVPFYPGPGVGGHCIPVDPLYLTWRTNRENIANEFIPLAAKINYSIRDYATDQIQSFLEGNIQNKTILIYGVAYKKDLDDIRESPALMIMEALINKGANVSFHDPYVSRIFINGKEHKGIEFNVANLSDADCVVILTDHSSLPIQDVLDHSKIVYDTRNVTKSLKGKAKIFHLGGGGK